MRPILLRLSAFGPYAEETRIPLDLLGDQGLYLITGDTGAGKTTIFDAICYALYGEPSGVTRDPSMFRSKYAKPETATFVELTFLHNGKEYRIERNPEYIRPAKRGGGEAKQDAGVTFYLPDGQVISKKGEVAKAVEDLIGLSRNQFSQISMLAQGDFLKLLLSSTSDRQVIFRKLFQTDLYEKLQKKIEEDRKEVEDEHKDASASVRQYIQGISCEEEDPLAPEAERAREGKTAIPDVADLIDRIIAGEEAASRKEEEELSVLRERMKEVHERIGTLESAAKAKDQMDLAVKELDELKKKSKPCHDRLEQAQAELKKKDDLLRQVGELEKEIPQYQKIQELKTEETQALQEYRKAEKSGNALQKRLEQAESEVTLLEEEAAGLKNAGEELQTLKVAKERSEELLRKLDDLSAEVREYEAVRREYKEEQDEYLVRKEAYQKARQKHDTIYQAYLDGQAGILAENLREGEPCPVCGATHHPSPAHKSEEVPTKEAVDAAQKEEERKQEQMEASSRKAEKKAAEAEAKEKGIQKEAEVLLKTTSIPEIPKVGNELYSEEKRKKKELEGRIVSEEARVKRRDELETLIPKRKKDIEEQKQNLAEIRTTMAAQKTRQEELEKQHRELASSLKYSGLEEIRERIGQLNTQAELLQKDFDRALSESRELETAIENCSGQIKGLEASSAGFDPEELLKQKVLSKDLSEQSEKQNTLLQERKSRIQNNDGIRKQIRKGAEKIDRIEKKLQWISNLADTVSGKMKGKNKIMLETYIQTTYFDRIIFRANLRLMQMTAGQYELKRADEAGIQGQSGLDLDVMDHHNGSVRSVKTLSGGESFMAALSLALGLSDEIQASAGGIRVDTVFVDEGFGSLDPEALDQAYRALASLTEGNMLVGIISHVEELKEKIDRQIIVTKDKEGGSRVRVQA